MTTETKFRVGLVITLLGLMIMTFEFFEKDRIYNEYKVSTTKQIYNLSSQVDSLKGEMQAQQMVTEHFVYLWEQMEGLHPEDAKKIQHETE